ncbi:hypothetical protein [Teredinibacter turnerae]|uniref:hypothetical protein n=1 Tax=Teredinibacter turnerae TaxID=2426 RepID=UPI0030D1D494
MYTEPFKFKFQEEVKDSKRMAALSEMFQLAERASVKRESFGGYKIQNDGTVEFWSYNPVLTEIVIGWLDQEKVSRMISVRKPKSQKNA